MKRAFYALVLVSLILPFAARAAAKEAAEPAAWDTVEETVWEGPAVWEEAEEMAWEELDALEEAAGKGLAAPREREGTAREKTAEEGTRARPATGYAVPLAEAEPRAVLAASSDVPTREEARARIMGKQNEYPEGAPWTNGDYYEWRGGIYIGGYGCAGFAFLLSDAAFGDLPAKLSRKIVYETLGSGDILRVDGNSHSVIILEVEEDFVVIAEGNYNYNGIIHWGRRLEKEDVLKADYVITRYPAGYQDPTPTPTPLATSTPTAAPTPLATLTPTAAPTPLATLTPTAAPTPLATSTPTAAPTPLATSTPTAAPTPLATSTPTAAPTPLATSTPTATPTPTASPTPTPSPTPFVLPTPPDEHSFLVTVEGGSGTGFYHEGDRVTVVMDPPPERMRLKSVLHSKEAVFSRVGSGEPVTYIFIMPDSDVTVRAVYEENVYTVTVTGGIGSGKYYPGDLVSVAADKAPAGKRLWGWTYSKGLGLNIRKGSNSIAATFTMPESAVWLAVIYADSEEGGAGRQWMRRIGGRVAVKAMDNEGRALESDAWLAAYADGGKLLYSAPAVYDAESGQSSLEMDLEGVKTLRAFFFMPNTYSPFTGKIYAIMD